MSGLHNRRWADLLDLLAFLTDGDCYVVGVTDLYDVLCGGTYRPGLRSSARHDSRLLTPPHFGLAGSH